MKYEFVPNWGKLPDGWYLQDVVGVRVDEDDNVFVFNRGNHPLIVFSPDGKVAATWGEGEFMRPHALEIDPSGALWCVDDLGHCVKKMSRDGKLLMTLGTPGQPADTGYRGDLESIRGGPPFNQCTNAFAHPNGDLYVTDGYRNCKVHRFAADGRLVQSWGEAGRGPGHFRLVHGVCADADRNLLVCDRANDRVQRFTPTGDYISEWTGVYQPCDAYRGHGGHFYVAELGRQDGVAGDLGARVTVRDADGHILASWGDRGDPAAPGNICAAHTAATDSSGSVYVGEVTHTARASRGLVPPDTHVFQKFVRVS